MSGTPSNQKGKITLGWLQDCLGNFLEVLEDFLEVGEGSLTCSFEEKWASNVIRRQTAPYVLTNRITSHVGAGRSIFPTPS